MNAISMVSGRSKVKGRKGDLAGFTQGSLWRYREGGMVLDSFILEEGGVHGGKMTSHLLSREGRWEAVHRQESLLEGGAVLSS